MKVLLCERHTAKVVSFNALVYAGSAIETDKEAGMCHVIEHMIFKGTPKRPVGAIARDIEAAGGEVNAYTSYDQTVFYINMASRFADKGLEIIADAVQHPLFDAVELEREIEVICEEIRRGKDNPSHCISEDLFSHAFTKHTYGRPIIGFYDTVKSFKRGDVLEFYKKHYTPDNITFIVVGDFVTADMLQKLENEFRSFKAEGPRQVSEPDVEPAQSAIKIHTNSMDIQGTHFLLGFHIPEVVHKDVPAIDVLSHILGGAESSRMEQVIKEKKRLVHAVYSYAYTPKYPGIFIVGGITNTDKTLKTLDAVWEEIQKICLETVSADELNRAKINIRAGEVYERESVGGYAGKLAYFLATAGNHDFEKRYFQMLNDVTAEDVRAAARKYLTSKNCTAELLFPKAEGSAPLKSAILAACTGDKHIVPVKRAIKTEPKLHKFPNGMKLIIRENHQLPIVSVYAVMFGGIRFETVKNNGMSYLLSRSLVKGTARRNAMGVTEKIESMAGMIDGFCGRNAIGLRSEFLSEKLHDGYGLFAEVLTSPSFDEDEVDKEKAQQIESIQNQEDNLHAVAFMSFLKELYRGHPYGMRMLGEISSVKKLNAGMLKKYWSDHLNPAQMCISVVGDVSPSEILKLTKEWIQLKRKKMVVPPKAKMTAPSDIRIKEILKKGKEQSHIVLGFMGTVFDSPDHYKLSVLNHILAGQGGRLFLTLRDKMSLAYSVNSTVQSGLEPGYFAVYIGTDPAKTETATNGIKKELEMIRKDMVTEEELDRAKQYMVGTYELDQQKNKALASSYAFDELYGLGIAEVERYPQKILKVTRKDILDVARKYIDMNAYALAVVKPK